MFLEPRAQKTCVLQGFWSLGLKRAVFWSLGLKTFTVCFTLFWEPGMASQSESMVDALCGVKASLMQNL